MTPGLDLVLCLVHPEEGYKAQHKATDEGAWEF